MKSLIRSSLFLLIGFSPAISHSQNALMREQNEVNKSILAIGRAWSQNNLDTLEKYIAPGYKHTDVRGQIQDRKTCLGDVAGRKEKNVKIPDIEFDDLQIQLDGDFAFVTGINRFSGSANSLNDPNALKIKSLRFTQVLKKEEGIWKRLLFQATYIE
jgi:ketosteroid isomerase-like protein